VNGEADAARRLTRTIVLELATVGIILGLVAAWRLTPPPRSLLAAAGTPVHVHIHSNAAMAEIEVAPPDAAGRTITIVVLDGQFGPLAAKEVTLFLSKPEAGIERLRLPATRTERGTWRIDAAQLPIGGRWQAQVDILVSDFEKVSLEDTIELPR
jgi:copper transport protein